MITETNAVAFRQNLGEMLSQVVGRGEKPDGGTGRGRRGEA